MAGGGQTILHVDLDAFYAGVEAREDPSIRGRPIVVGADPLGGRGRGVVAAASYEARSFGIHSAMPISQAYRLCPDAVFLRPRMELYARISRRFLGILGRFTDLVEPLSIDEAFLDATGSESLFGGGEELARRIKAAVRSEEGLTASVGVAPVKFVAKIASDLGKPDGLVVVAPDEVESFLDPLPVGRLWGAGPKAVAQFQRLGVRRVGDLRRLSFDRLAVELGASAARHFADLARGIDPRPVCPEHERKSVGREVTFPTDVTERREVERALLGLVEEVAHRLRRDDLAGSVVTVKLRTDDFTTVSRQERLFDPADTVEALWPVARRLLQRADTSQKAIRLVGVAVSSFDGVAQLPLFPAPDVERQRRLARAVDTVTAKFGEQAVRRAATLGPDRERD